MKWKWLGPDGLVHMADLVTDTDLGIERWDITLCGQLATTAQRKVIPGWYKVTDDFISCQKCFDTEKETACQNQ